jgi:hypothetical protein
VSLRTRRLRSAALRARRRQLNDARENFDRELQAFEDSRLEHLARIRITPRFARPMWELI